MHGRLDRRGPRYGCDFLGLRAVVHQGLAEEITLSVRLAVISSKVQPPETDNPGSWITYWKACGQPWRREPEIGPQRKQYLARLLRGARTGIAPFKGQRIIRGDIEWLLASFGDLPHEGQSLEMNLSRLRRDLLGADLSRVNWRGLDAAKILAARSSAHSQEPRVSQVEGNGSSAREHRNQNRDPVVTQDESTQLTQTAFQLDEKLQSTTRQDSNMTVTDKRAPDPEVVEFMATYALGERDFYRRKLRGKDLRGVNLSRVDLSEAELAGVDLRFANLTSACLVKANLASARLAGAILRDADFQYANLDGADLSSADLERADLSYANLAGANLRGARMAHTDIHGAFWGSQPSEDDAALWACSAFVDPRASLDDFWSGNGR